MGGGAIQQAEKQLNILRNVCLSVTDDQTREEDPSNLTPPIDTYHLLPGSEVFNVPACFSQLNAHLLRRLLLLGQLVARLLEGLR